MVASTSSDTVDTRGEALSWDLSPTDLPNGSLLVYLPVAFLGGHVGLVLVTGAALVPAILADLRLLALAVLLVLVGGPFSLVYLWPMLRNPEQRPSDFERGWLAHVSVRGALVASLLGTVAFVGGARVFGSWTRLVLAGVLGVAPLALLGVFDTHGSVDRDAGTLTSWHRTATIRNLAGIRCHRFYNVTLCLLSYAEGAGGFGRPYLVVLPETVADDVLEILERGVAADPDVDTREPDPVARAVLAGVAVLFFGVAGGALLALEAATVLLALVSGGLGCLFALGAYYLA